MLRKSLIGALALGLVATTALAGTWLDSGGTQGVLSVMHWINGGVATPVSAANPLPVTATQSGASGTPSQTAVSVGVTSTTVLTAAGATSFVKLCLAQSAANGIWVNWAGAAAVAAAPSEYMAPGQCDPWVKSTGYLPTSQINAIASAAVSVTLIHD